MMPVILASWKQTQVGVYAEILGRGGVRSTVHSALHYAHTIEDHGELVFMDVWALVHAGLVCLRKPALNQFRSQLQNISFPCLPVVFRNFRTFPRL